MSHITAEQLLDQHSPALRHFLGARCRDADLTASCCRKSPCALRQHFDLEEQLRVLEVGDIARRLAEVRAESQRRREKRTELIKFAVDDIVRDAIRPR